VLDWFSDPLQYRFMRLALIEVMIMGTVAGFLGTYVVIRGLAFVGEAIAHSVFPGVVIAFLLGVSLFLGGLVFGLVVALGISLLSLTRRLREDTAIGVVFAGALAFGVVLISTSPGYTRDLTSFLFGDVLAVTTTDIYLSAAVGGSAVFIGLVLRRAILLSSFDREMAVAVGLPVFWLDTLLLVLIAVSIVVSLQAVGNILVLAMFVTPAATARLLVDEVGRMMFLSATIGATAGVVGLYMSWHTDLAAGGMIVLTATSFFVAAMILSPKHGLVRRLIWKRPLVPEPDPVEVGV
jgi:manganese/iron transport system permease protein